jgi:hypothetical protein
MSQATYRTNHTPLIVLGLAMTLGPLTALSVGSRVADEETFARAQAGAENIERRAIQAAIADRTQTESDMQTLADAMQRAEGGDS